MNASVKRACARKPQSTKNDLDDNSFFRKKEITIHNENRTRQQFTFVWIIPLPGYFNNTMRRTERPVCFDPGLLFSQLSAPTINFAYFDGSAHFCLSKKCGFGTFSNRPVNSTDIARRKLEALAHAARIMREK